MLTLAIFGISGATGLALAREAVARGHRVTGLVRPESAIFSLPDVCRVVRGELRDRTAIDDALRGADAACCVFGPRPPHRDVFCAAATRSIVSGMNGAGITRLICQTGAMIAPSPRNVSGPLRFMAGMFARQRPEVARDRVEQERIVEQSGLEWTLVKPPRLTDRLPGGRATGREFSAGPDIRVGLTSRVCRTSLAGLLLDLAGSSRHVRERIYVAASRGE